MWLILLVFAALLIAVLGSLIGLAFLAIPIGVVIAGIAIWVVAHEGVEVAGGNPRAAGATRSESPQATPQDTQTAGKAHVKTGFAHEGQETAVPDQDRAAS